MVSMSMYTGAKTVVVRRVYGNSDCFEVRSICTKVQENEVALQWVEMSVVRSWMCGIKLEGRILVPSKGLRDRLTLDDMISVLPQNRLRCYGRVQRKGDNDWVNKSLVYEVEGARPRGGSRKLGNTHTHTHRHTTILRPSWILSGTTWVSRHQKGKTRKVKPI